VFIFLFTEPSPKSIFRVSLLKPDPFFSLYVILHFVYYNIHHKQGDIFLKDIGKVNLFSFFAKVRKIIELLDWYNYALYA